MMSDKQHAYAPIDRVGPSQLAAVVRLLETMVYDEEEEVTAEDRQVVAASREYFRQNPEGGVTGGWRSRLHLGPDLRAEGRLKRAREATVEEDPVSSQRSGRGAGDRAACRAGDPAGDY